MENGFGGAWLYRIPESVWKFSHFLNPMGEARPAGAPFNEISIDTKMIAWRAGTFRISGIPGDFQDIVDYFAAVLGRAGCATARLPHM